MVGMLQIITYLICIYLVFKAIEIFQIAFVSDGANRKAGLIIGMIAVTAAIIIGIAFSIWIDGQASAISNIQR